MKLKLLLIPTILLASLAFNVSAAQAVTTPDFPNCANPQGTLKVSYDEGVHGIVGRSAEYKGSDSVYQVNDNTLLQCFCSEDGNGIQTNWWKIDSLTEDEIQTLKNLGWSYVPNGALWGLEDAVYMAKSDEYACSGSEESDAGTGGQVLGLATTGNIGTLYGFLIAGLGSLAFGFYLRYRAHQNS